MQHKDTAKTTLSIIHKSSELVAQMGKHLSKTQKECLKTVLSLDNDAQVLALHPEQQKDQDLQFERDILQNSQAIAVVSLCELVSQWAERKKMLLVLPIYQESEADQQNLMDLFCSETLGTNQGNILGLLTFSHKQPNTIGFPQFVQGWKFVLTVSFPIEEEAIWIMPLNGDALEHRGGEVDLPQALAKVWDCAN